MRLPSGLSAAVAVTGASAAALSYTDSNTGITFSGFTDGKGYTFGMALPESPSTDYIAQIVAPITNGGGWAGFDSGASMANKLLIVAWPNGKEVMISPRMAVTYANPPVYSSAVTFKTIPAGTFVNQTHFSATYLCAGCITNSDVTFSPSDTDGSFGYAYSNRAVANPTDSSTSLTFHSAGFGRFDMSLTSAKSSQYDAWAALATGSLPHSPGTNPNKPAPGTNGTAPITVSNTTYDYIVAGGGPAGIIVAERLAESGASVLLLERGGPSTASTGGKAMVSWNSSVTQYDVPAMAYYLTSAADTSEYCTDTASQAGCLLGGGTMVNAMMFVPPQDIDFDDKWPTGWKSADVSSAAQRLFTRNPGTNLPSRDGKRYDQGAHEVLSKFFQTNGWNEVEPLKEPNKKVDAFSYPPWNIQNSMRGGPVKTYLPLAQKLTNFKLSLNTKVIRAVRNGTWVSGVEVENGDGTHQIINVTPSTGKVILAAGAMSTPRILFYSGIGPADQIKAVPSSVTLPESSEWINLPVGKGIQDHPIMTITLGTKTPLTCLAPSAFTSPNSTDVEQFAQGSGLLVQSGQRLNFWTAVKSPSDGITRYLQGTCNSPSDNMVRIKVYVTHGLTSSTDLVLDSTGVNTQFTGSPWLQTQGDIEAYEGFLDRLIQMAGRPDSSLMLQLVDGSTAPTNITGAALFENLKSTVTTGSHFVRSARIGLDDGRQANGSAVVDTDVKVYGTDNLFVVDASMHADLPTGNTQAIVMVTAERAAEKILALDGKKIDGGSLSSPAPGGSGSQGTGVGGPSGKQGARRRSDRLSRRRLHGGLRVEGSV